MLAAGVPAMFEARMANAAVVATGAILTILVGIKLAMRRRGTALN